MDEFVFKMFCLIHSMNQKRTDYSGVKQKNVSGTLHTVNC